MKTKHGFLICDQSFPLDFSEFGKLDHEIRGFISVGNQLNMSLFTHLIENVSSK
jgi:hypothetical protein